MTFADSGAAQPRDDETLEVRLNRLLAGRQDIRLATAESCTGGNVARRITSVAGSSDYFLGGVVSYANSAKIVLLGVPEAILASAGAVSAECAAAMAEGARRAFGAEIAVSTTGIAGPGGATARKPVGLVYVGCAADGEPDVEMHHFQGDRAQVIEAATNRALALLLAAVEARLRRRTAPAA